MAIPVDLGYAYMTHEELVRECENKQRVINYLNELIDKRQSEAPREGWIPVSERLPEIDMSKATYERGTKVLMAWGPSQQNVGEGHYTANWYSKQAKALAPKFYWQGRIAPWKITHWMHFPAGPGRSEGKT